MIRFAIVAAMLATVGVASVGVLWWRSIGAATVAPPKPRGPSAVGLDVYDWTDKSRNRELMVFVWYPAQVPVGSRAEYLPPKWRELAKSKLLPEVSGAALQHAPMANRQFPLLVLLPGMGGIPTDYTTIAEDLASFGYIVAGIAPTGSSRVVVFPNGRVVRGTDGIDLEQRPAQQSVVERWQTDCRFVLDSILAESQWRLYIDQSRVGVFGHSFGGAVALHVLQNDPRFRRAANLDGAPQGNAIAHLDRPVLFFNGAPLPASQQALNDKILAEMKAICQSDTAGCEWKDYSEAGHMNFSDRGAMPLAWPLPKSHFELTNIDGVAFLRLVASDLNAFFGQM